MRLIKVLPPHTDLLARRMDFAFILPTLPVLAKRRSRANFTVMANPTKSSHSPKLSRRNMLLSIAVLTSSLGNSAPSHSYSSPYRPDQRTEKPLPDRLYESSANKVVQTSSGLQYFDLLLGEGKEATDGDTVFVYYTSRLRGLNGIKIQSTYDDSSTPPFIFKVGDKDVVPGVSEAVRGMKVGGKRRAVLPPQIAYASADMKPVVTEFFARRRLLSVLETSRDATIVFE